MGRAIIGGVITSTLLTLVVVPVLYTYLDAWTERRKARRARRSRRRRCACPRRLTCDNGIANRGRKASPRRGIEAQIAACLGPGPASRAVTRIVDRRARRCPRITATVHRPDPVNEFPL